jgi:hypothetical protein
LKFLAKIGSVKHEDLKIGALEGFSADYPRGMILFEAALSPA